MALVNCPECKKQISSEAPLCPSCGYKLKKDRTKYGCGTLIAVLVIGYFVASAVTALAPQDGATGASAERAPSPREKALQGVSLHQLSYRKGGFDSILMLNTTVRNAGDAPVKDLEITCQHYAKSGTRVDRSQRTLFQTVAAKGETRLRDFSMGFMHSQTHTINYEVTDLALVSP